MDVEFDRGAGQRVAERHPADFASAARRLATQSDLGDTLRAVLTEGLRLGLGDAVGVLLVQGRALLPAAASEASATLADALQVECGEGPGVETLISGRPAAVDLRQDEGWSRWAPQVVQLGWEAVLSVGLVAEKPFGVLDLYFRQSGEPDPDVVQAAEVFATHAALAISVARERESLARAMEGRNLIGQAQGILMERYGLQAEQAFDVLRRYSSHGNRKLRQVAEDLIEQRRLPELSTEE